MDSPAVTPGSVLSSNDENPRVKFLCSFSGSILPRPQDSKLRYVGGETRIVSVPRDITYQELMVKMKELYETVTILKYQQPDEDLDALVSVVNDDDVTNMMEEYDKLGLGDGFTRLRIFLFASSDQDGSLHFGEGDERDHERRYVDALNSLNDSPRVESPIMGSLDDLQYFSQLNLEGSVHGQRNMELPIAQMNLRHLTIPRTSSQQQVTQRYSEMEAPWSPAYYSPRHPEFPISPSSSRYRTPYGEYSAEDYGRPPMHAHMVYDPPQYAENVVLVSAGAVEKAGFPCNILQGPGVYEGSNVCENCRGTFQRNQVYPEPPKTDYVLNSDPNIMHPSYYCANHNDQRSMYHQENRVHERDWISPHHSNHWVEESRPIMSVSGRLPDNNYIIENGMGMSHVGDRPRMHSPYIHHGGHVYQDQAQIHLPPVHGNPPYAYGTDNNLYQVPHGHMPPQTMWRNVHSPPVQGPPVPSYETSIPPQLVNEPVGPGFVAPKVRTVSESQNPWSEPPHKLVSPEYSHGQAVKLTPNTYTLENHQMHVVDPMQSEAVLVKFEVPKDPTPLVPDDKLITIVAASEENSGNGDDVTEPVTVNGNGASDDAIAHSSPENTNDPEPAAENGVGVDMVESAPEQLHDDRLDVLPELIASAKEAALQSVKEVKARVEEDPNLRHEDAQNDTHGVVDGNGDLEVDFEYENVNKSKIEETKAETEARDRGLQTIKNEDLEEIKELGSGTYGSVFHGKWRGSDVAIKRIKASCFAGRPSERERLIADFWKEAQILSSLHHPNVVSFYGVVRDGPDGSLATVTEFMINGSLKQFLQKKDRTIDRRKRLIIGMDAAFGMEYLHGKNIVHFDLKCENLLVNMRDPHRPVCKIGDLGLSKVKQHTLVSGGVRGTLPWMAPELLSGKSHMVSEKIDVYSFGICMWELLTGDEPYTDMHCASIIGGIVNNTLRPQIPTWCDPEWKALMESCWASEPVQRPSFSEISQKLRTMAAAMNLK